jgi:cold shock CspA family protein
MQGTMLWFNLDKGYGFIHTEEGERLYVARSGFLANHDPEPRCKGREVRFHRQVREGDTRAVAVSFVRPEPSQRARLRTSRSGHAIA